MTSAAASITRTAGGKHGSWQANVVLNASASVISGIWYDLSAVTFKAGVTYRFSAWVKYNSVLNPVGAAIYSNGTVADIGSVTTSSSNLWVNLTGNWTPTVDRNDVHFSVYALDVGGSLLIVDSCAVWVVDSNEGWLDLNYADPLCLSSAAKESAIARVVGTGPYGLGTYIKATAASNASLCMPFWAALDWTGGTPGGGGTAPALETFTQGQQYTATAWLSGNGTGKITLGKQSLPAGAVSSGTAALSGSWTQFHVSWTAPAGADSLDVVLVAETTSTQLNVGGVVVAQGATTWDWCPTVGMDGLDAAEDALHVCRITPSGRPLDVLKELNAASFSRHWCEPLATYPWWRYRTRVLSSLSGKSVAETYNDDLSGYTGDEQSYDSLINVVLIDTGGSYFNAGVYTHYDNQHSHFDMEDAASIALNGRITTAIASDYLELSTASVGDIGTYILANYAQQRRRFTITVENRWPSQLDRDLDDLIVLNIARLGIANGRFIIVGITHTISDTGRHWTTQYQLEQAPPT